MRLIFILCLLLPSVSAFGQIDGKGIFCALETASDESKKEFYEDTKLNGIDAKLIRMGVFFSKGQFFTKIPIMDNDVIIYIETDSEEYRVTQNHIIMDESAYLDRKTLILSDSYSGSVQCEVFDSKFSFEKEAERLLVILQSAYDNLRKDNKI